MCAQLWQYARSTLNREVLSQVKSELCWLLTTDILGNNFTVHLYFVFEYFKLTLGFVLV